MANSTNTQVLLDGSRNAVVKFEAILDTSDLAQMVLIDPATLTGIDNTLNRKAANFRISKLTYNVKTPGMHVTLWWDGSTPTRIEELSSVDNTTFEPFGGLINNAPSPTGKILVSTTGWSGVATFSIVLELEKTGA